MSVAPSSRSRKEPGVEPAPAAPAVAEPHTDAVRPASRGANPTRRDARECAVQLLFQLDLNGSDKLDQVFALFWKARDREFAPLDEKTRAFAERMVRGVRGNLTAVDDAIRKCAANWDIKRMATVDRNVLRMGIYEMLFCHDVPPVVSINEAVDLA
jgi:transcription antitermination protein NusB